jgi:hypothetical protein
LRDKVSSKIDELDVINEKYSKLNKDVSEKGD